MTCVLWGGKMIGLPRLLWEDVAPFFDPETNGCLPDVRVPGATVADWQGLLDQVRSSGWACDYSEGPQVLPAPWRAGEFLARCEHGAALRVQPVSGMTAIFRPFVVGQIDFDMSLRELQGQERLDVFCGFLQAIGRALRKPVLMTWEGTSDAACPFLGYRVELDEVVLLADPLRPWAAPEAW